MLLLLHTFAENNLKNTMEEPENPKTSRGKLILIFIMETQKVSGGFSKAAMIFGIISVVFALLPMLSAWFMFLTILNYLLAPLGVICGIIAIVKSQNLTKSIIGIILCVLAICAPLLLAECYLESTVESAGNMLDFMSNF